MVTLIGVDIGQKQDPTAIVVAEVENRKVGERSENHFIIRNLQTMPLGTRYPKVADRIREIVDRVRVKTGEDPEELYVDATGVGQPIVDLLEEVVPRVTAVYFNYGDQRRKNADGSIRLGKAYLVSRLQALQQTGRVHLPRNPEAEVLKKELLEYEIRIDENANDRYGAFKVGSHDDLVTALGLAVQVDVGDPDGVFMW